MGMKGLKIWLDRVRAEVRPFDPKGSDGCTCSPDYNEAIHSACVEHDEWYHVIREADWSSGKLKRAARKWADQMFYDDLILAGFPKVLAYIRWLAVRLFGWLVT